MTTRLDRSLKEFVTANVPEESPPPLQMSRDDAPAHRWAPWLLAAAVLALVVTGAGLWWTGRDTAGTDDGIRVLDLAASSDHLPSASARDWTTYADHVLLVTVISDDEVPPTPEEVRRGEGLIGRNVTARVDDVLWSRPDPDRPAPVSVTWQAWGWIFSGGVDDRQPVVGRATSRVEVGHTYVVALAWEAERCAVGDPKEPAHWTPLGSHAVVPADDGLVGVGEFEGKDRSVEEAIAAGPATGPGATLAGVLAGEPVAALAERLDATTPGRPKEFTPPAPCE